MFGGLLGLLKGLFGFLNQFAVFLKSKQDQDAGRAIERSVAQEEVVHEVKAAQDAVVVADPVRTERLRNRFDRSRAGDSQ